MYLYIYFLLKLVITRLLNRRGNMNNSHNNVVICFDLLSYSVGLRDLWMSICKCCTSIPSLGSHEVLHLPFFLVE